MWSVCAVVCLRPEIVNFNIFLNREIRNTLNTSFYIDASLAAYVAANSTLKMPLIFISTFNQVMAGNY